MFIDSVHLNVITSLLVLRAHDDTRLLRIHARVRNEKSSDVPLLIYIHMLVSEENACQIIGTPWRIHLTEKNIQIVVGLM